MSNNNSNQLLAYPIIEELGYRSQIDSKKLNEMLRSLEESVLRSLLRGTKLQEDFNRFNLAVNSSYQALLSKMTSMTVYPTATYGGFPSFASAYGEVSGVQRNDIAGIVTMPWNSINGKLSKIAVYDGVVSPNIQIYVDDVLRPITDPVYNILDQDASTFWCEQTTVGEHTLELVLPNSINKTFNYLEVVPFPIFGMEIKRIDYYDLQSRIINLFPNNAPTFYNWYGPLIFHCSPREFNNIIKITFDVKEGIETMGFSSIDVSNIKYISNTNTFYMKFENIPTSLTELVPSIVELDFYVDGVLDENYDKFITEIKLVSERSTDNGLALQKTKFQRLTGETNSTATTLTLENAGELWLKVVMNEVNKTSPVFRGVKLIYN